MFRHSCGRIAGEELLKQIALTIEKTTRDSDSVGRITGSEFSILLEKCPNDVALNVGIKLVEAIQKVKYSWEFTTTITVLVFTMVVVTVQF